MYSRFPQDRASSDDSDSQSTDIEQLTDKVISINCDQNIDAIRTLMGEATENAPGAALGANTAQMAYLQLMTQKVMDAVVNNPDVIKLMNSAIRKDQDE